MPYRFTGFLLAQTLVVDMQTAPGGPLPADVPQTDAPGRPEPHAGGARGRLNWLRAGVLGANDGVVSVAGIVVGVAGATPGRAGVHRGPGRPGRGGGVDGLG